MVVLMKTKYTLEEEIIHFVFLAFYGLKRKKEDVDLSFHSIMVGIMLKNIGCSEDIVYIGYLHDIIEDSNYTYLDLENRFGKEIADGVLNLSENQSISDYRKRKSNFIENLYSVDHSLILVEVADKLQNLISDYELYLNKGRLSLITECENYEDLKWYYLELQKLFHAKLENNSLLDRYDEIVSEYFS